MTDKIIITKGQREGSFSASVPSWATDETLSQMAKKIDFTNALIESSLTDNQKAAAKKAAADARANSNAERANSAQTQAQKDTMSASAGLLGKLDEGQKLEREQFKYTQQSLRGLAKGLSSHNAESLIGGVFGIIGEFAGELKYIGHVLAGPIAMGLEGFAGIMTWLISSTTSLNKEFDTLTENGITYGSSMRELTVQAGNAGLRLEEYGALLKKNAATTTYLGTAATGKLISQFNTLSKRGSEYGISQAEADEELLNYTDTLRQTGLLQNKSTSDIVKLNDSYQRELGSVVALTGENRKQLEESIKARFTDLDLQVALAALPEQVRMNMENKVLPEISKAFGEKGAQALNKPLAGYLARGLGGVGPEFTNLLASTGTFAAFQKIGEISKAGGDPSAALREFADQLSDPRVSQMMSQFAAFPGPLGDAARQMIELKMSSENLRKGLTADGKKLSDEDRRRMAAQADFNAAMNKLNTSFMEFAIAATPAAISSLKIFTAVVTALTGPIKFVASQLEGLGNIVHDIFNLGNTKDKDGKYTDANQERHAQIASGVAQTGAILGATTIASIGLKFIPGMIMGMFKKKSGLPKLPVPNLPDLPVPDLAENLAGTAGKAGGKRGIGGMLSSLGGGIGDLGRGLGGGIGTLLKEVAGGLAAFANPATALGLGAVTLAIIGLSAAMRIAAPAFEPFGRMLKLVFEGIGEGLANAGKIIGTVGQAIKLVIQGVGESIATVMTGAASSLVTISSINPAKLLALAPGIAAVGAALVPFGIGTAAAGVGGTLSRTANALAAGTVSAITGLNKRFGGPAAARPGEIAHTPQTTDLAASTAAYQKNMQDMTKRMVELLVRCELELRALNDQTDKGHDRLVAAFKKAGQVY